MRGPSRSTLAKASATALVLPLVLAGCGTRLNDAELGLGDTGEVAVVQTAGDATQTGGGAALAPGAPVVDTGVTGPAAGPAQVATDPDSGSPGTTASSAPSSGAGGAVASVLGPKSPCTKTLDPINLGQNGVFSGLTQPNLQGSRPGMAAWAADVNARGGVQCHPIRLFQTDDGSNPARTVANTKDMIQNKKVVAMIGPAIPFTTAAYRSVVSQAGMPTIGGDNIDPAWDTDPFLYPTGVTTLPGMALAMKSAAETTGNKKWAIIYCVESAACTATNTAAEQLAKEAGVQVVSKQSVSLTQTDYTSNCQTAKSAGAESVLTVLDAASIIRMFRSCSAIGFYPPTATTGLGIAANVIADPNVQRATVTTSVAGLPYFSPSFPQIAAYQAVMKKYAPSIPFDNSSMVSYLSGKLFEAALGKVFAEARSGPVTTALVLKGLNSIKGDTLGGLLAAPLTFKAGQPHAAINCAFINVVQAGGIADPRNGKPICLDGAGGGNDAAGNTSNGTAGDTKAGAPATDLRTGSRTVAGRNGRRS